eukprot:351682-Chlamydomonas_euryale.AAC.4
MCGEEGAARHGSRRTVWRGSGCLTGAGLMLLTVCRCSRLGGVLLATRQCRKLGGVLPDRRDVTSVGKNGGQTDSLNAKHVHVGPPPLHKAKRSVASSITKPNPWRALLMCVLCAAPLPGCAGVHRPRFEEAGDARRRRHRHHRVVC